MTDPQHPDRAATRAAGDLVGSILAGRYRIIAKLGEGAMGAVYVGEHLRIGRRDAIKVLNESLATDREAALRFMRGARNVSAIRHPNVCTIYDFSDTAEGKQFMAMELVPGETLKDLLEREGALPLERAVRIAAQAADALEAAHDAGIVHRDLKPANIMVAPGKAGADLVKVVDFDIAKGSKDGEGAEVTRLGFVVGTPEYMSPEQLIGEALDGRSDVYSLALVLFRMLSGALPFRSKGTQDLMIERLTETALRLDEVQPGAWPPALQAALDRALQRRAEDRTGSAAEFGAELRAAIGAAGAAAGHAGAAPGGGASGGRPAGAAAAWAGASGGVSATRVAGAPSATPGYGVGPGHAADLPPTTVAPAGAPGVAGAARKRAGDEDRRRRIALISGGVGIAAVLLVTAIVLIDGGSSGTGDSGGTIDIGQFDPGPGGQQQGGTEGGGTQGDAGGGRVGGGTDPGGAGGDDSGGGGNVANRGGGGGGGGNTGGDSGGAQGSGAIVVTAAGAFDRLLGLVDRMTRSSPRATIVAARDTARAYYDLVDSLAPTDRALAAYVVALGYSTVDDVAQMRLWAQRALSLNPNSDAAKELLRRGGGSHP